MDNITTDRYKNLTLCYLEEYGIVCLGHIEKFVRGHFLLM